LVAALVHQTVASLKFGTACDQLKLDPDRFFPSCACSFRAKQRNRTKNKTNNADFHRKHPFAVQCSPTSLEVMSSGRVITSEGSGEKIFEEVLGNPEAAE
jgi:hypothetical protein